jgi:hypothetical protein
MARRMDGSPLAGSWMWIFSFLAVKLMICSVMRNGEENGWQSSGWELDVDFLFLALFLQLYTSDTTRHKRETESKSTYAPLYSR